MTIEQMRVRKTELGLTNEMIAEASGVPLGTVQKIFGGATKAPRRLTIEALEQVLKEKPEEKEVLYRQRTQAENPKIRETSGVYGALQERKLFTIDDYYALPDERRVELIDGVFYDMAAPSMIHQEILGDLHILFRECVKQHEMPCKVFLSPCDVRLDRDDYTMVQPDLFVFCHEYDRDAIRYEGAPDLVIEILSPSTRMKDMILKLQKYQQAGVREYWIVDPKHQNVIVHCFEDEDYSPEQYSFQDVIPVRISGGVCSIDFSGVGA
ncbi:MAG: Uma2 family endonuclease [Eubacterium sp.]|nr:Uma2 family endonuclease [Eubacterium sp.]